MENRSSGSWDIPEKVVCSPSKVPLIIQLSQQRLHHFLRIRDKFEYEVWDNSLKRTPRYSQEVFVLQGKCPYLLINRNRTCAYRMHATLELWNDENPSNVSRDTVEEVVSSFCVYITREIRSRLLCRSELISLFASDWNTEHVKKQPNSVSNASLCNITEYVYLLQISTGRTKGISFRFDVVGNGVGIWRTREELPEKRSDLHTLSLYWWYMFMLYLNTAGITSLTGHCSMTAALCTRFLNKFKSGRIWMFNFRNCSTQGREEHFARGPRYNSTAYPLVSVT